MVYTSIFMGCLVYVSYTIASWLIGTPLLSDIVVAITVEGDLLPRTCMAVYARYAMQRRLY